MEAVVVAVIGAVGVILAAVVRNSTKELRANGGDHLKDQMTWLVGEHVKTTERVNSHDRELGEIRTFIRLPKGG